MIILYQTAQMILRKPQKFVRNYFQTNSILVSIKLKISKPIS